MAMGFDRMSFKQAVLGTAVGRIIVLNVAIFVIFNVLSIFIDVNTLASWTAVSSDPHALLTHPWTVLVYMVTQWSFIHLFSNMLWFWGFGYILSRFVGGSEMTRLYILGGLVGAVAFVACGTPMVLVGASASVCAVIGGLTTFMPRERVRLMFFGDVQMMWIGIIALVLMIMSTSTYNSLGAMSAHIAGAATGLLYGYIKRTKRIDITHFMAFKIKLPAKSQPKASSNKTSQGMPRRGLNTEEQEELDRILAKVKKSGYAGLTEMEKRRLFDVSKKIR